MRIIFRTILLIAALFIGGCDDDKAKNPTTVSSSDFERALKEKKNLSTAELDRFFPDTVSVNKREASSNYTPLQAACIHNNLGATKYLIAKGAYVNEVHNNPDHGIDGYPALWFASVVHRNVEMVRTLLDAGADIRQGPKRNALATAHMIASAGYTEIMELFLKKDPTVANWNLFIGTPLHQAANAQRISTIKLLLDYGADKSVKDSEGNTAWHLASASTKASLPELEFH